MSQPHSPSPTSLSRPTTPSARQDRDLLAWGLLAAVVLVGLMAGPFYFGYVYTADDLGSFHLPVRAFYSGQLARGEPFDWMPDLYSGFYLTGEGQAGTYHPLHWLLYRFLRLEAAMGGELLLSYPLMLAGMFLLLRRGFGRAGPAMFGSLVFGFGSFNLLHFVHPNAIAIVAHIPWLMWLIDVALAGPKGTVPFSLRENRDRPQRAWLAAVAIALLTGSQVLLGYPQYVWFSLLAESAYAAWLLYARHDRRLWGRCAGLAAAKTLGLLIAAVQLLPTIDALSHSVRHGVDAAFTNSGSLHPLNLVQVLAPYLFAERTAGGNTHEFGMYLGAVPLMLLVWLRYRNRPLGRLKPFVMAAAGFSIVCLLLATGSIGQLYRLQRLLPLVGGFRCPCRYLVLWQLGMSAIAAIAMLLMVRQRQRSRKSSWEEIKPLWVAVAASAIAALVGLVMQGHELIAAPGKILLGPFLMAAAALAVTLAARGWRWAPVGLVLLTAVDLGAYGLSYAVYPGAERLPDYVASVALPPDRPIARVAADLVRLGDSAPYVGNQMLLGGWQRADGYAGLEPRRSLDYRQLPVLQTAGVGWVGDTPRTAGIAGLEPSGDGWLRVPDPLPRARLVTRVRTSSAPAADLPGIDVRTTALVDRPLELPASTPGTATIVVDRPGRLEIDVDCPAPQLLVVAESYHPGWRVEKGSDPFIRVLRVNGDFLGCAVGPGRQRVVLTFMPDSLRLGRWLSLAGLGLAGVMVLLAWKTSHEP